MSPKLAPRLRACCAAVVLAAAAMQGADIPPHPAVGMTLEQVINKYGEPKSQIAAGNRVVIFFANERMILRDGVVIEAEKIGADPAARRIQKQQQAPVQLSTPTAQPTAEGTPAAAPATPTAPQNASTAAAPVGATPAPAPMAAPVAATPAAVDTATADTPEPKLEIKSVRPPTWNYIRPNPKKGATVAITPSAADSAGSKPSLSEAAPAAPTATAVVVTPQTAPKAETTVTAPASVPPPATKGDAPPTTVATVSTSAPTATAPASAPATVETSEPAAAEKAKAEADAKEQELAAAKAAREKKAKIAKARRKLNDISADEQPDIADAFLTPRTFLIGFIVLGGGVGFLYWRHRQRQLLLAATAVSGTPFASPVAATGAGGTIFKPELLARLEWKRFEELVAAYYSKTGVVATRTKNGPHTPVHIKISWKGEPRPFACVQCIAHPPGLVDAKPLQELFAVLTAEDIRRGYVVTSGKFNVNARDFAEEKHITLLPGDIFLEKLNALPDLARTEIMQAITTGDYQTPSCPKCDAKMVRTHDDPPTWKCPNHSDQLIPVWK